MWEEETLKTVGNKVFFYNLETSLQFVHIDKQSIVLINQAKTEIVHEKIHLVTSQKDTSKHSFPLNSKLTMIFYFFY